MRYKYIAESSEQCKDLEERMRRFEEHFSILFLEGNGLVISDDKIRGEVEKVDSATKIEPDEYSKVKLVGMQKIRDNTESKIFMVDEEGIYALIGNSFYSIKYKTN